MHLEYPECILEIDEMNAIFDAEEVVGQKFEDNIADCDSNTSIAGSSEAGIRRREKILGINPQDTDSLELRRFRVIVKWYDSYPYTQESLMNKMDILLGNGNYTLAVVPEEMRMICLLGLNKKDMENEFRKLLEEIVPLNIILDIDLRYNKWKRMRKYTYGDLRKYTWEDLRSNGDFEAPPTTWKMLRKYKYNQLAKAWEDI